MEVAQVVARFLKETICDSVEHFLVFGDNDALSNRIVISSMVILKWLVVSVAYHAHHGLHEGLSRAQIPILEPGDQVGVKVGFLVKHVDNLVSSAGHSRDMYHIKRIKYLIHALLILIHRSDCPHVVVFARDAIFGWEGRQRRNSLQPSQLLWKLVFDENTALGRAEVGPSLP